MARLEILVIILDVQKDRCEIAGCPDVPVAEGTSEPLKVDYLLADSSITNPLSRQRIINPNVQYAPVQSRVTTNPVEQKKSDSRMQIQQQYQDLRYLLPTQYDPQHHPQLQQPQFIHVGSQYVQHLSMGAVPMPAYYPVYSSQQPHHSHHPVIEQQYPVYYVPARQT
ncbi:hypothetical protein AgCh_003397 [Apium graveolens]